MSNLLTVAEYAEKNKTSVQNVYSKIKRHKLKTVDKKDETGRTIKYIVVEDKEEKKEETIPEENSNIDIENNSDEQNKGEKEPENEFEKDIISFLKEQIREKDRQLAEKDKQIDKIQQLLNQEQQLHARTNLLLAEYKEKEKQEEKQEEDNKEEVIKEEKNTNSSEEYKTIWDKIKEWLTL